MDLVDRFWETSMYVVSRPFSSVLCGQTLLETADACKCQAEPDLAATSRPMGGILCRCGRPAESGDALDALKPWPEKQTEDPK